MDAKKFIDDEVELRLKSANIRTSSKTASYHAIDPNTELDQNAPEVYKTVVVTEHAQGNLKSYSGESAIITGVLKRFNQVVGYRVNLDNKEYFAAPGDVYVDFNYLKNIHVDSDFTQEIKECLREYSTQSDYYGPDWEGIEKFCFQLAKVTDSLAVESSGWYKYQSSGSSGMDGKDWRMVIPDGIKDIAVNCHSLLHDNVWTLTTTVLSTTNIERSQLDIVGDFDIWKRSMIWAIGTAKELATSGYDYSKIIEDMESRLAKVDDLHEDLERVKKELRVFPEDHISIGLARWPIHVGTLGNYQHSKKRGYKVIFLHPKLLEMGEEKIENSFRTLLRQASGI